ncbi:MAG TPA: spore germination protein GerPB [Bacillales bacterium]
MNFYITQNIDIHLLKVGGITNSSVLQIGSAGCINTLANLYNTGGYTEPAPELEQPGAPLPGPEQTAGAPAVPLGSPSP